MDSVRIDKYLWAIRVFKTRSDATDACNGNKVKLAGVNAKPSKAVKAGDVLEIRKGSALFSYRVLKVTEARMGAALVPDYAEDLTPESERAKLHSECWRNRKGAQSSAFPSSSTISYCRMLWSVISTSSSLHLYFRFHLRRKEFQPRVR